MSLEHPPARSGPSAPEGGVEPEATEPVQPRAILRLRQVMRITGDSRTTIWRKVKAGTFPAPVQIGPNAIGWYADEIAARQESLPRVSWAPQGAAP